MKLKKITFICFAAAKTNPKNDFNKKIFEENQELCDVTQFGQPRSSFRRSQCILSLTIEDIFMNWNHYMSTSVVYHFPK